MRDEARDLLGASTSTASSLGVYENQVGDISVTVRRRPARTRTEAGVTGGARSLVRARSFDLGEVSRASGTALGIARRRAAGPAFPLLDRAHRAAFLPCCDSAHDEQLPQSDIAIRIVLDLASTVFHRVGKQARGPAVELDGYLWWPKVDETARSRGAADDDGDGVAEATPNIDTLRGIRRKMRAAASTSAKYSDDAFSIAFGAASTGLRQSADLSAHAMTLIALVTLLAWRLEKEKLAHQRRLPNCHKAVIACRDLLFLILQKYQADIGRRDFTLSFAAIVESATPLVVSGRGLGVPLLPEVSFGDDDLFAAMDAADEQEEEDARSQAATRRAAGLARAAAGDADQPVAATAKDDDEVDFDLGCLYT